MKGKGDMGNKKDLKVELEGKTYNLANPKEYKEFNKAVSNKRHIFIYYESDNPLTRFLHFKRLRHILKHIPKDKKILDVGCSYGFFLKMISERREPERVTGVDLNPEDVERAKSLGLPNSDFYTGDAEDLNFLSPNSMDVVVCTEVLEHVRKPKNALKEFKRVLRPGGKLILTVPNDKKLHLIKKLIHKFKLGKFFKNPPTGENSGHLHVFSKKIILKLLEKSGFEIKKATRFPKPLNIIVLVVAENK